MNNEMLEVFEPYIQKYPDLIQDPYFPACDYGWFPLITKAFDDLEKLKDSKGISLLNHVRIRQLKEKLGDIRIYWQDARFKETTDEDLIKSNQQIKDVFKNLEKEASTTCENCGAKNARLITKGYLQTLCETCAKSKKN